MEFLRYDYKTQKVHRATIKGEANASFIIPLKCCKNQLVVGLDRGVKIIEWNGQSSRAKIIRTLFKVEQSPIYSNNNMNDGKASPNGNLYAGTLRETLCSSSPAASGSLYRYTKDSSVRRLFDDVKISNG